MKFGIVVAALSSLLWPVTSTQFHCFNCHGIPDFCAEPTCVVEDSGFWDQVAESGRNEVVVIPSGVTVEIPKGADVVVHSLGVHGRLIVRGKLTFVNLLIYGDGEELWLDGAREVIRDVTPTDPEQWGTGHLTEGRTTYAGSVRKPSVKAIGNLTVGQTVIPVDDEADWRVGDEIVIPDVRQGRFADGPDWHDRRTISAIGGGTITINNGLSFAHAEMRATNGMLWESVPILNLTRGIKITSENPNGARGHWAAVGRADLRLVGVEFSDLGRTEYIFNGQLEQTKTTRNQIGRYAGPHLHHVYGPASSHNDWQWEIHSCSVHDMNKNGWGFTIHQSHYGRMQDCVAWGGLSGPTLAVGAGIATEDGPEYRNVFQNCWSGNALSAFWFVGPAQTINQCVALDAAIGYEFGRVGKANPKWRFPTRRGAEPATYAEGAEKQFCPIDFSNNEAVGVWNVAVNWGHVPAEQVRTEDAPLLFVLGPMRGTNITNGYNGYYDDFGVKLVGWRLHQNTAGKGNKEKYGFAHGGNSCARMEVEDFELDGFETGLYLRPRGAGSRTILRRGSMRVGTGVLGNILMQSPAFGNVLCLLEDVQIRERLPQSTYKGQPINIHTAINLGQPTPAGKHPHPLLSNRFIVRNYGGNPDDDFECFWKCQAPDVVLKAAAGVPGHLVGLTNQQAFDAYGQCLCGAIAPSGTRPGIIGFVEHQGSPYAATLRTVQFPENLIRSMEEWVLTTSPEQIINQLSRHADTR